MAKEFFVNGQEYTHMPLDAFTQLHVSRKTGPLFVGMAMEKTAVTLLHDIADDDLESTLKRIMPFVRRKNNGAWTAIYNVDASRFMFDDIGGGEVMEIMFNVLMDYLPDFFAAIDRITYGTSQPVAIAEAMANTPQ